MIQVNSRNNIIPGLLEKFPQGIKTKVFNHGIHYSLGDFILYYLKCCGMEVVASNRNIQVELPLNGT